MRVTVVRYVLELKFGTSVRGVPLSDPEYLPFVQIPYKKLPDVSWLKPILVIALNPSAS